MGIVDDVRNLERMLAHREQEKNGGLPSGHPFLRDAAKRREQREQKKNEEQLISIDTNAIKDALTNLRNAAVAMARACDAATTNSNEQAMRVSDSSEVRQMGALLGRVRRFAHSVEMGANEQLRKLK